MTRRRTRPSPLPRGPALVAVLAIGCGSSKTDQPEVIAPQVRSTAADARVDPPPQIAPQVAPPDAAATDAAELDAAAAAADDAKLPRQAPQAIMRKIPGKAPVVTPLDRKR